MNDTFERVREVIAETMSISRERITMDTHVINELAPDSMDDVEIIMGLEKEFEVNLGDDTYELGTVCDIVNRIDVVLTERETETQ